MRDQMVLNHELENLVPAQHDNSDNASAMSH